VNRSWRLNCTVLHCTVLCKSGRRIRRRYARFEVLSAAFVKIEILWACLLSSDATDDSSALLGNVRVSLHVDIA